MSPVTAKKPEKQADEVPGVALLYKAFRVIDAVAEAKRPPRITDLLRTTGLSKGTLYRLLQALVDRRYLRIDSANQTYHLGTHLFDLSHAVWANFDLRSAAASEMMSPALQEIDSVVEVPACIVICFSTL